MRNLKRALSLALASVMLLGMMVVGTSAASYPDVKDSDNVEAIEVLNAVGVMIGDRGNFRPDAAVNRHEMAAIMARLLLGEEAETYTGSHPFTDVYPWADKYVAACYEYGVINGTSKTTFSGNQPLTAVQAAAMMLRALGYEYLTRDASDWRAPVVAEANKIKLFNGVVSSPNAKLNRNQVAQLALNTLEANMVITTDYANTVTTPDGTVVKTGRPSYDPQPAKATDPKYDGVNDLVQQLCEKLYGDKLKKTTASVVTDYGLPATKWTYPNAATVIGKYATDEAVYTWTNGIEDITLGNLEKILGTTSALAIYENGAANGTITPVKGSSTKSLTNYKGATIYAVDTDDDTVADRLCVVYPYLAQVTKVTEAKDNADRKITLDVWNSTSKTSNVTFETEDFDKDDYVMVYVKGTVSANGFKGATTLGNDIIEIKPAETVVGQISTVSGTNGTSVKALTVDGTKYTVGGANLANKGTASGTAVSGGSYGFTSDYTLFMSNGYILGVDGKNESKDISNIVYVVTTYGSVTDEWGADAFNRVQLIRMDGTTEVVKTEKDKTAASDDGTGSGNDTAGTAIAAGFYTMKDEDNDNRYEFTKAVATTATALDNSTNYYGTNAVDGSGSPVAMKADTKTIAIDAVNTDGNTKAYLTENSRIIYVKGDKGDLKTSMVLGPVKQNVADNSVVLLSKSGNNYIVETLIVANTEQVNSSDDVVYVKSSVEGQKDVGGKKVNLYKIYDTKTGESSLVPCETTPTAGFVTYAIDKDGKYSFTAVPTPANNNDDGQYDIADNTKFTWYEKDNLVTVDDTKDIVDKDASGVCIINLAGDDELSLKALDDATILTGKAYLCDDKVVAIVVDTITTADAPDTDPISLTLTTPAADTDNTITVNQSTKTVTVSVENTTASVVIGFTKTSDQSLAKSGADQSLATINASDVTVNTSSIASAGGSKTFTLTVSEAGKQSISYSVTVTVAAP